MITVENAGDSLGIKIHYVRVPPMPEDRVNLDKAEIITARIPKPVGNKDILQGAPQLNQKRADGHSHSRHHIKKCGANLDNAEVRVARIPKPAGSEDVLPGAPHLNQEQGDGHSHRRHHIKIFGVNLENAEGRNAQNPTPEGNKDVLHGPPHLKQERGDGHSDGRHQIKIFGMNLQNAEVRTTRTLKPSGNKDVYQGALALNPERGESHSHGRHHIKKCSAIATTLHLPKLKNPNGLQRVCGLPPPGTGVYYSPRRSINSKGYGESCTIEALSLLADVSCKLKFIRDQRSSNLAPDSSKKRVYQEHNLQKRSGETMSAPKDYRKSCRKEHSNDQRPRKLAALVKENSYKVVRKMRTPRRSATVVALGCSTKLQKSISLSGCENIFSHKGAESSLIVTGRSSDLQPASDTSERTFTSKRNLCEDEGKSSKDPVTYFEVPPDSQRAKNLVRFSRILCQANDTKKGIFKRPTRKERFSRKVLMLIGERAIAEKPIREVLGNNPDVSKALRLLLAQHKVKRLGGGGRGRAYVYVATEIGLRQLHGLEPAGEALELTPGFETSTSCNPNAGIATFVSDFCNSELQPIATQHTKGPGASGKSMDVSHPCLAMHAHLQMTRVEPLGSPELEESEITQC